MKTALEILNEQNKLKNEYDKKQIKIKGQLRLIEDKINTFKLTPISKYINLGNMGDIYEENLVEILNAGYFIDNINNETHLYFNKTLYDNDVINKMKSSDETDYNNYINSNKNSIKDVKEQSSELKNKIEDCNKRYKEALKKLNDDIYSSKKTNLKNDLDKQGKENNQIEAKDYDTIEDFATDIWNNIFNKYNL